MRGSFVQHRIVKKRICRKLCVLTAALVLAAGLLSGCGPEPGTEESSGQAGGGMFAEQGPEPGNGAPGEGAAGSATGQGAAASQGNTADAGSTEMNAQPGGVPPAGAASAGASTGAAAENMFSHPIQGEITQTDAQTLEELQAYLNEDSSYGFLLSSYDIPEEIDLNQVFYSGAGFKQEKLTDKEEELLLDRIPQEEIITPVVKVKDDQIEELLEQKAGITYDESRKQLDEEDGWVRINRYDTWYALRGDTNRQYIRCSDAWQQGNLYIVHYQLTTQAPAENTGAAGESETAANTADTTAAAAEVADTAAEAAAEETAADTAHAAAAEAETAAETAAAKVADTAAEAAAEETAADTADTAAAAVQTSTETITAVEEKNALYSPTYEVQLQKTAEGYRFCYNIIWTQKNLIEAQSYRAELKPSGEVFFAPFYPDTEKDEKADVTFVLEQDRAVLAVLSPMEENNIRTDRIFEGVNAVDFTDYNQDGYTDILTICSYTQIAEDGKKTDGALEARVYTGQKDGVPVLDRKKTEEVNQNVEVLNITNAEEYLTGKTDGSAKIYSNWKEAFADHIRGVSEEEYEGFELIYLNDDRTPELVQVGETDAKGATIIVYRNGTLEETWLNRRDFQYLEYENLLYSPSGVENLHYDTIYSISGGKLGVSTQGYYGNSSFARVRFDENGKEAWNYFWEGGEVSESGYRDGINFIFDMSRAKTCDGNALLTAEELLEQLK